MNSKYPKQHHAVQIVEILSNSEFRAKRQVISEIYNDPRVATLPIIVFCIAGASRKGKSFMLNFFLDFLNHMENNPKSPWKIDENTRLAGFEFKDGEHPTTMGIWAWNHVFVIEQSNGKKVAVSLIDSQGTFDNNTEYEDSSTIFAMTSIFSSVMCFNVFTDLLENVLNDLSTFIDHGKRIVENLGGSGKLFQDFVFIIRDFGYKKYFNEENGGQKYVENVLSGGKKPQLQQVRDVINASHERLHGISTSRRSDISPKFVETAKRMVEELLLHGKTKKVGPTEIRCKDMPGYIAQNVKCFGENRKFAPQAVQVVNRTFMISTEVVQAIEGYNTKMDQAFLKCKTGHENAKILELHKNAVAQIQEEINQRINNAEISAEVIEKFVKNARESFAKYKEKNDLLVENEKKRLQMIEEKQQHEENLAKQESENEKQRAADQKENQENLKKLQEDSDRKLAEEIQERENDKTKYDKTIANLKTESEEKIAAVKAVTDKKIAESDRKIKDLMSQRRKEQVGDAASDFMKMMGAMAGGYVSSRNNYPSNYSPPQGGNGGGNMRPQGDYSNSSQSSFGNPLSSSTYPDTPPSPTRYPANSGFLTSSFFDQNSSPNGYTGYSSNTIASSMDLPNSFTSSLYSNGNRRLGLPSQGIPPTPPRGYPRNPSGIPGNPRYSGPLRGSSSSAYPSYGPPMP